LAAVETALASGNLTEANLKIASNEVHNDTKSYRGTLDIPMSNYIKAPKVGKCMNGLSAIAADGRVGGRNNFNTVEKCSKSCDVDFNCQLFDLNSDGC
jgi:hypothetical protein